MNTRSWFHSSKTPVLGLAAYGLCLLPILPGGLSAQGDAFSRSLDAYCVELLSRAVEDEYVSDSEYAARVERAVSDLGVLVALLDSGDRGVTTSYDANRGELRLYKSGGRVPDSCLLPGPIPYINTEGPVRLLRSDRGRRMLRVSVPLSSEEARARDIAQARVTVALYLDVKAVNGILDFQPVGFRAFQGSPRSRDVFAEWFADSSGGAPAHHDALDVPRPELLDSGVAPGPARSPSASGSLRVSEADRYWPRALGDYDPSTGGRNVTPLPLEGACEQEFGQGWVLATWSEVSAAVRSGVGVAFEDETSNTNVAFVRHNQSPEGFAQVRRVRDWYSAGSAPRVPSSQIAGSGSNAIFLGEPFGYPIRAICVQSTDQKQDRHVTAPSEARSGSRIGPLPSRDAVILHDDRSYTFYQEDFEPCFDWEQLAPEVKVGTLMTAAHRSAPMWNQVGVLKPRPRIGQQVGILAKSSATRSACRNTALIEYSVPASEVLVGDWRRDLERCPVEDPRWPLPRTACRTLLSTFALGTTHTFYTVVKTEGLRRVPNNISQARASMTEFRISDRPIASSDVSDRTCRARFGSSYRLADWSDIRVAISSGITPDAVFSEGHAWISRDGATHAGGGRYYFASRMPVHSGYAAHDRIDGVFALGSWHSRYPILCVRGSLTRRP